MNRRPQTQLPGVISPSDAYTRDEFLSRVGRSPEQGTSLSDMERRGLKVVRDERRVYVLGEDWIDYLRRLRAKQYHEPGSPELTPVHGSG